MLHRFYSHHFLALAEAIERLSELMDAPPKNWNAMLAYRGEGKPQKPHGKALPSFLKIVKEACDMAGLKHSADLVECAISDAPETSRELRMIINSIRKEMERHTYLRIGEPEAQYYENEDLLDGVIADKFPTAAVELYRAGNAYACGLPDGSVFYAMRAAEIGIRVLATDLGVTFPHGDLRLEQWHSILEQMESKITALKNQSKSTKKSEDQAFYSQCAAQLRYFKDGFRIRAIHAYDDVSEKKALAILNHTMEFFEYASDRLAEK